MSFIAFANNEASALRIYEKTDTVSIISEQPSYLQCHKEKKEEIWLSPMTKALTPTKNSNKQSDNTKNATKRRQYLS